MDTKLKLMAAPATMGLSESLREELRQQLRALAIPVILVTHDDAEAQLLGDQLIALTGGRVMAQ